MDMYPNLIEMGFTHEAIEQALKVGCLTFEEIVDFLCHENSNTGHLYIPRPRRSQFVNFPLIPSEAPIDLEPTPISSSSTSDNHSVLTEEENLVHSRKSMLKQSFDELQAEARRLTDELRKEKQSAAETRLRIRLEIENERALRAKQSKERENLPQEDYLTSSAIADSALASLASSKIKIRVTFPSHWSSSTSGPYIGQFDRSSATLADLQNFVQNLMEAHSIEEHGQLSLYLPCIRLSTMETPRRQLNDASSGHCLLTDLGIVQNTRVFVSHHPDQCQCRLTPEPSVEPMVESNLSSRSASPEPQEPFDVNFIPSYLRPINPDLILPPPPPPPPPPQPSLSGSNLQGQPRTRFPPGRSGSAAIWRALQPRRPLDIIARNPVNCRDVPSLCRICLKSVTELVKSVTDGGSRFDIHAVLDRLSTALDSGTILALRHLNSGIFPLPQNLGSEVVRRLCSSYTFNPAAASLLKNFVCDLDLGHYEMISSELVMSLVKHWTCLRVLRLGGHGRSVNPYAIQEIGKLSNLRVLRLKGINGVDNNTISVLATLPKLEILQIQTTNVTSNGWCQLQSLCESGTQAVSPLRYLSISDTFLHDIGLSAIVKLFPQLVKLDIDGTKVCGFAPVVSQITPLSHLRYLNVNASKIFCLPPCLLPPITAGTHGLVSIDIRNCFDLRIDYFLGQLTGQPIAYLSGFFTLKNLSFRHLHRLADMCLPLVEVNLASIKRSGELSLSELCQILTKFSTSQLRNIFLPMGASHIDEEGSAEELVACLAAMKHLNYLDFGGQAALLTSEQLFRLAGSMPSLGCVVARNLGPEQERLIRRALPAQCRLRVQNCVVANGDNNTSDRAVA